jgi:hypothetical protein
MEYKNFSGLIRMKSWDLYADRDEMICQLYSRHQPDIDALDYVSMSGIESRWEAPSLFFELVL